MNEKEAEWLRESAPQSEYAPQINGDWVTKLICNCVLVASIACVLILLALAVLMAVE